MQLLKTADNSGYIRIEEQCGAAITLSCDNDNADIISLYIPEEKRREGIGSLLISAANQEVYNRGIKTMEANFSNNIKGMKKLFEKAGFEVSDNAPICSVSMEKLLASKKIINTIKKKTDKAKFVSFDMLKMKQWDTFFKLISGQFLMLTSKDITRFSKKISGLVYDEQGEIRAYIFCTEKEDHVNIDYLGTSDSGDSTYIMEALKGMVNNLIVSGKNQTYPELTAVCVNDNATKLMKNVISDDLEVIGMALRAKKKISDEERVNIEIYEDHDDDLYYEWDREIAKVPMQANIGLKTTLYRDKNN